MKFGYLVIGLALLLGPFAVLNGQEQHTIDDSDLKLVSFVDLQYPHAARMGRVQGVVVVKATLDGDGNVTAASAISGHKGLIPDCLTNIRKWKFVPNRNKSAVVVYEFRREVGACHDESNSFFRLVHMNFASITICEPVLIG